MRCVILAAIICSAISTAASAEDIHLACDGVGTVTRSDHTTQRAFDWRSGRMVVVAGPSVYDVQMPDRILVDIAHGDGRIKVPVLLSTIERVGSDDGWRPLTALRVEDAEIRGQFSLSLPTDPTVTIDRATGHIEVAGQGASFTGDCRPDQAEVGQGLSPRG